MAKDKYTFDQLNAREIKGPGITLTSPCNSELLQDLQAHWKSKPAEKRESKFVTIQDSNPVVTVNKCGVRKRYPNMAAVALAFGYAETAMIRKLINKGEELRGGLKVRFAEGDECN